MIQYTSKSDSRCNKTLVLNSSRGPCHTVLRLYVNKVESTNGLAQADFVCLNNVLIALATLKKMCNIKFMLVSQDFCQDL